LQISTDVAYAPNAADLTSEIQRLKADAAPVLIQASYVADATLSIKTYKQLGYLPKILIAQDAGFVDSTFIKNVGKDAQAMISREVWALDLGAKKPIVTSVNDLFKSQYKTNMNGNSARTFTGVFVIADAINRAKSTQPAAIQNALKTTDLKSSHLIMPWDGVKFDEKGQNTQGAGILIQIQDGEYKTVWPDSVASAKIIYPLPDWAK
ncbi:MAG TPA: ABC transporter substrate-binding protein, partial [Chloroflexota bacterium]